MKRPELKTLLRHTTSATIIGTCVLAASISLGVHTAHAKKSNAPALTITNDPLPPHLQRKIYGTPSVHTDITADDVIGDSYYSSMDSGQTGVARKIKQFQNDLVDIQSQISNLSDDLMRAQSAGQNKAAEYYASVATINTQLQSGTTPGNPRLIKKLDIARNNLEDLSRNISTLNDLAVKTSNVASMSAFLLESVQAAYSLSGAIEEDHIHLAQLEDSINNTVVIIDRILNNISDDITRTAAYLNSEKENLRTLSMAISTGDLIGKSLANRPFSGAEQARFETNNGLAASQMGAPTKPDSHRPLVKIRFDRPDVSYEQPVYMAVNEALTRYPDARFELVAIHPSMGNAAQVAIESTKSRRNAERVLRSLKEMGLDLNRVDLSYTPSNKVASNEVHLYIH